MQNPERYMDDANLKKSLQRALSDLKFEYGHEKISALLSVGFSVAGLVCKLIPEDELKENYDISLDAMRDSLDRHVWDTINDYLR